MKKNILIVFVILLSVSCKKILEKQPLDFISPENFYKTETELNTALTGVYNTLQNPSLYGNDLYANFTACTDEGFYARSNQFIGPMVNNISPADARVNELWTTLYQGVERANLLLSRIDESPVDTTRKNSIKGEALFLRALFYYHLVTNWGAVPLKTKPNSSVVEVDIAKTAEKEVYNQIIADLKNAEPLVKRITAIGNSGRVSRTAVQAFLARVYITMAGFPLNDVAKYTDVIEWTNKVIASGEHALNPDYKQIFINYAQDKYDIKENLFEVEFWGNRRGNTFLASGRLGNTNGIAATDENFGYSYGFINATARMYSLYADSAALTSRDLRRQWNIAPFRYSSFLNGVPTIVNFTTVQLYERNCGKFRREYEPFTEKDKNYTNQNFPVIRYADVLLMLAEAENEVNGATTIAYNAINEVRRRGWGKLLPGATNINEADLTAGLLKDQFKQAIRDERARELCFEALRKTDLLRWGNFVLDMKSVGNQITLSAPAGFKYAALGYNNLSQRDLLLPIPFIELSTNKSITQNPLW